MDYDDRENNDNDFDFENQEGGNGGQEGAQKIENQHFDEAVDLESEGGSEIESAEEDQADEARQANQQQPGPQNPGVPSKAQKNNQPGKLPPNQQHQSQQRGEDEYSEGDEAKPVNIPGAYNPNDYANLNVQQEVKELFKYITRYKPVTIELDTKLRPFVPEYIPAVGEVDAFLKMDRPDNKDEVLGLHILDEPSLNQSKKSKLDLIYGQNRKAHKNKQNQQIHSIEHAEKNPREILSWINDVSEVHKKKQPPSVSYSRQMPDIDTLMRIWPPEIEDALQALQMPTAELDISLQDFATLACTLMDIPIYPQNPERNVIESLHVLFTLYSEFKSNQHFQQNKDSENYQPGNSYDMQQQQMMH